MKKLLLALPVSLTLLLSACGSSSSPSTTTDTTAPTVSLAATPTTLTAAGTVTLTATASDTSGIASVKFYRNGTLIATDTASPYTYSDTVSTSGTTSSTAISTGNTAAVVAAANAFLAAPSTTQQVSVVLDRTQARAIAWSNLPCGSSCRNGIQLSTLTTTQKAVALALIKAAIGTTTDEISQIMAADDVLGASRTGYGSGIYFLAFLGTPSTTGEWQLQFGGHHLAHNITFSGGSVIGAIPSLKV